jgi:hypothetical protein
LAARVVAARSLVRISTLSVREPPVRHNFQGAQSLAAGVSILRSVLIAAVASALTAAGASAAEVSLGPTIPLSSGPVPAGDVRFGNGFPEVVVRQASGVLDVEGIGASGLVEPTGLTATWPYRELWVRDVINDDAAAADLVGRDGGRVVAGIDAHGRVYAGVTDGERFLPLHDQGRIPTDASMVLTEITGDSHADLVYRRRGHDDVYVHPGAYVRGKPVFLAARRLGRWDHRLTLTPTAFGPTLAARDPRTGVVMQAEARRSER